MSKQSKSLLSLEYLDEKDQNIFSRLLKKDDLKKPNFEFIEKSSLISKLNDFIPQFKKDTQELLQNDKKLKKQSLEPSTIKRTTKIIRKYKSYVRKHKIDQNVIDMNLLCGVFDTHEKEQEFKLKLP